jgi:CO/xanthine dehydrogenase Mo-binding subunit
VRIHVPFVGGAFGAKNNCRNEALAALLARMTRRPVRLCYSFDESFHTLSQHAARLTLRTGVMRDGTLVARESEILLDAGAYTDASPLVCDKAGYRVGGAYRWEALLSRCSAVVTNTVPAGPYRGFGGPQASWAAESQLDTIARRLGIDPYEIRVKNLLQLGEPFLPGESGIDSDLQLGLDLVCERLGYHRRAPVYGRGMGLAVGIKDGGGQNKPAQARIKLTPDGHALLHCGSVELGQGIATALSEVVAAVLKIPREWVTYTAIDTDLTPYDQGTNSASGGTVMGRAVEAAAREVRERVLRFAAAELGCDPGELDLERWCVVRGGDALPVGDLTARAFGRAGLDFEGFGFFKMPYEESAPHHAQTMFWECGWAGAEVEVDESTGTVRVVRLIVSGDPGKTLNPAAAHGQEEANALANYAQAMFERMIYADGRLCNPTALSYRVLTANDLPSGFEMLFQEQGHGPGPFGSKGAGEGSLLVVASAIANAVEDAIGVRVTKLPLSPENVYDAIQASRAQSSHGRRTSGFM